jgi:hypothetical protein
MPENGIGINLGKLRQKLLGSSPNKKGTKQEEVNRNVIQPSVAVKLLPAVIYT